MFIDPDGDAQNYVELEINALNTVWDLFLEKPYRDGGHADNAFDIVGLKTGVRDPGHAEPSGATPTRRGRSRWRSRGASLERASETTSAPRPGQRWRINYSRVEWRTTVENGAYQKVPGLREDNWVWSPQGDGRHAPARALGLRRVLRRAGRPPPRDAGAAGGAARRLPRRPLLPGAERLPGGRVRRHHGVPLAAPGGGDGAAGACAPRRAVGDLADRHGARLAGGRHRELRLDRRPGGQQGRSTTSTSPSTAGTPSRSPASGTPPRATGRCAEPTAPASASARRWWTSSRTSSAT